MYNQFFAQSLELILTRNCAVLTDILVDFERKSINVLSNLQQQLEIKGCFYYLCANILQSLGFQVLYNKKPEFSLHLRVLSTLVFVSPQNVADGFNALTDLIKKTYND